MGSTKALSNFENLFWCFHDERLAKGLFIGKDQTIMNMIALNMPQSIVKLQTWDTDFSVNEQFLYQYYLASDQFYECKQPKEEFLIF